jgi:hypothetical protein
MFRIPAHPDVSAAQPFQKQDINSTNCRKYNLSKQQVIITVILLLCLFILVIMQDLFLLHYLNRTNAKTWSVMTVASVVEWSFFFSHTTTFLLNSLSFMVLFSDRKVFRST